MWGRGEARTTEKVIKNFGIEHIKRYVCPNIEISVIIFSAPRWLFFLGLFFNVLKQVPSPPQKCFADKKNSHDCPSAENTMTRFSFWVILTSDGSWNRSAAPRSVLHGGWADFSLPPQTMTQFTTRGETREAVGPRAFTTMQTLCHTIPPVASTTALRTREGNRLTQRTSEERNTLEHFTMITAKPRAFLIRTFVLFTACSWKKKKTLLVTPCVTSPAV